MKEAGNDRSTKSLCDPTPFYFHVWDTECCDNTDCLWHRFLDNTPTYVLIAECCQRLYKTRTYCFLFWLDTFRKDAYNNAQSDFDNHTFCLRMCLKKMHISILRVVLTFPKIVQRVDFSKKCPKGWLFLARSWTADLLMSPHSIEMHRVSVHSTV